MISSELLIMALLILFGMAGLFGVAIINLRAS
jgi:hypothetical protein